MGCDCCCKFVSYAILYLQLENSKSLTQRPGSRLPTALKHSHTTATHKSPQKRRTISKSTALNSAGTVILLHMYVYVSFILLKILIRLR